MIYLVCTTFYLTGLKRCTAHPKCQAFTDVLRLLLRILLSSAAMCTAGTNIPFSISSPKGIVSSSSFIQHNFSQ